MRNSNNFTPLIPVVPRESLHTRTSCKEATGSRAIDHAQESVDEAVGSSSLVHPKRAGQRYPAGTSTSSASVERKENTRLGASSAGHTGRSLATFAGKERTLRKRSSSREKLSAPSCKPRSTHALCPLSLNPTALARLPRRARTPARRRYDCPPGSAPTKKAGSRRRSLSSAGSRLDRAAGRRWARVGRSARGG